MLSAEPRLSVLVPSRNRAVLLQDMLASLAAAQDATAADVEVLIIDNGSTDATASVIGSWVKGGPRRIGMYVERPGQSHALNCAIRAARAPLLAFTDDDVQVTQGWLTAILDFAAAHPAYAAAMGPVLVPPDVTDSDLVARAWLYETLPLFDRGSEVCTLSEMYGCNMVIRRAALEAVGGFDERLGPGTSGFGGDTDLADRILRAGLRIGYNPKAILYHVIEPARLTLSFFAKYHRQKAQGDFIRLGGVCDKNVSRLLDATLRFLWCRVTGDEPRRIRAYMRMIRHSEFLRLRWRRYRGVTMKPSEPTAP